MDKRIIDQKEFLEPKMKGMKKLAGIVKATLGPGGKVIVIERLGQALDGSRLGPKLTKDGVSVAEECSDPDKAVDVVIQAVKAICKKTNADAGDGTTTAIVLGEAILEETEKVLKEDSALNAQLVRESIEEASRAVVEQLRTLAVPVKDLKLIDEVATISANGDREIGDVIGRAFKHVGAEGVVTVDEGTSNKVTLDVVEGYQFNRGAEARDVFFNSKNRTHFEAEDTNGVAIVMFDGKLYNYTDTIPMLMMLADVDEKTGRARKQPPAIVLIANEFSPTVLQFLAMQKQEKGLQICCVEGPHMTHVRTGYYDDLAVFTEGRRLGNGGASLSAITAEDVGYVKRVVVDKYKTTMYDFDDLPEEESKEREDRMIERVDQLKAAKAAAESPYDGQVISDRIAALTSGVAKIGVGGLTELEIKEKYDRIEDALNAARAAIQEGVVPGGGTALLRIASKLDPNKSVGTKILKRALTRPFQQILANIEVTLDDEMLCKICETANLVYDARNKSLVDCMVAGIIDPVKVTRCALENAVSIAGLLSTTGGAIIYENPK